jgi:hypothetical protein
MWIVGERGLRIPRTYRLADIAAENPFAEPGLQLVIDFATVFDVEVGDATPRV